MKSMSLFRRSLLLAALMASTVCLSLAGGGASAQQAGAFEPDFAAIDRFVESERQAMQIPGMEIGIVRGNEVIHLAGFGQADPSRRPVTAETPMITASITKSFTAMR